MYDDNSNLSDVTIEMDIDSLIDVCNLWNNNMSQIDLSSINVKQSFSPLNLCDIAVSYIPSLDSSLKKLLNLTSSISKIVVDAAERQLIVDNNGTSDDFIPTNNNSDTRNNTNSYVNDSVKTSVDNSSKNIDIDTDFINKVNSLPLNSYNSIMNVLASMATSEHSITSLLDDANYSNFLKETLLNSSDIPSDLKNVIFEMDSNVLRNTLRFFVNDYSIMDVTSKNLLYEYTEAFTTGKNITISEILANRTSLATVLTDFGNYSTVLTDLLNDDDFNKKIYDICNAESALGNKNDSFVKGIVERIATAENTTPNLLIDKNNGNDLKMSIESMAKSFKYLNNLGYTDMQTSKSVISEILQ